MTHVSHPLSPGRLIVCLKLLYLSDISSRGPHSASFWTTMTQLAARWNMTVLWVSFSSVEILITWAERQMTRCWSTQLEGFNRNIAGGSCTGSTISHGFKRPPKSILDLSLKTLDTFLKPRDALSIGVCNVRKEKKTPKHSRCTRIPINARRNIFQPKQIPVLAMEGMSSDQLLKQGH
jgi:hypothetical protein